MQQVTRRPAAKKKTPHQRMMANRRRQKRRQKREVQRKLKQKLVRLIDMIGYGHYSGVKESPLVSANFSYVKRVLSRRLQVR
jgi:hypothetical protein